ncbi:MAG: glycoside hydrolase family 3 N-terminal domain-containing protein [Bryobacteraceae bacterium]
MTLREKIAQLVVVPCEGEPRSSRSAEYRKYLHWVRDLRVGGLIMMNAFENGSMRKDQPYGMAVFLNRMQKAAAVPLLVGGDFERGDSTRVESELKFPHAMAFAATGDTSLSRYEGEITGRQARAIGVPWIFAPVADVNNNPDNPIINIRSYGENPEEVAAHVRAFIEGAHASGGPVLVCAKHFPGHGDTATDSHLDLAVLGVDKARLESLELVPFRAAIAAGADSIMTAHIAVPALDQPDLPSTLSRAVLTGLLREELQFHGLIVTDALTMNGVAKQWTPAQSAVKAIEAGADVLLMPPDPEAAIDGVLHAVKQGRIARARIDESVRRVLAAKARLGLNRRRTVDPDALLDELDQPEDVARVQEIADRAVTLVRNGGNLLPLPKKAVASFLVLTESHYSTEGRDFAREVRARVPDARIAILEPSVSDAVFEQALAGTKDAEAVVVAAFASVAAYRGSVALAGGYPKLLDALIASGKPVVLIALGNPYLVRSFPGVSAYLAAYSPVPPSEIAAAKALFGEIAIQGRLPVTIPGIAKYGDGIKLALAPMP